MYQINVASYVAIFSSTTTVFPTLQWKLLCTSAEQQKINFIRIFDCCTSPRSRKFCAQQFFTIEPGAAKLFEKKVSITIAKKSPFLSSCNFQFMPTMVNGITKKNINLMIEN
jgi:hypothetical protein